MREHTQANTKICTRTVLEEVELQVTQTLSVPCPFHFLILNEKGRDLDFSAGATRNPHNGNPESSLYLTKRSWTFVSEGIQNLWTDV